MSEKNRADKLQGRIEKQPKAPADSRKPEYCAESGTTTHKHPLHWEGEDLLSHGPATAGEPHDHEIVHRADGSWYLAEAKDDESDPTHTHDVNLEIDQGAKKESKMTATPRAARLLKRLAEANFQAGDSVLSEMGDEVKEAVLSILGKDSHPVFVIEDDVEELLSIKPGKSVASDGENSVSPVTVDGMRCALIKGPVTALFVSREDSKKVRQFKQGGKPADKKEEDAPTDEAGAIFDPKKLADMQKRYRDEKDPAKKTALGVAIKKYQSASRQKKQTQANLHQSDAQRAAEMEKDLHDLEAAYAAEKDPEKKRNRAAGIQSTKDHIKRLRDRNWSAADYAKHYKS
jgi:hypothetical protein